MAKTKNKSFLGSVSSNLPPLTKNQIVILVIIAVLGVLYLARSLFFAAIVNGMPITRIAIINELEHQAGKQTLDTTIDKTLILQEAKRQNVVVTKEEIAQDVKKIEDSLAKQGQNFDQLLTAQGMTRDQFTEQLKIQKMVQQMLGKDIVITDEEIDKFLKDSKASIPEGTSEAQLRESAKEQLKNQKIGEKYQTWIEDLRKKAKIYTFVDY